MKKNSNTDTANKSTSLHKELDRLRRLEAEHEHIKRSLQYRIELEKLITEISTRFISLDFIEIDNAIHETLDRIGTFSGADRAHMFAFQKDETSVSGVYEWRAEGTPSHLAEFRQGGYFEPFPWIGGKLVNKEPIHIRRTSDLPGEAAFEKKKLREWGVESLVYVPMISGNRIFGLLGFESTNENQEWTEETVSLLRVVGEIFSNAIIRQRNEAELHRGRNRLESVIREIPDIYYRTDLEGKVLITNLNGARFLGFESTRDVIGFSVLDRFRNPGDSFGPLLIHLLEHGQASNYETRLTTQSGEEIFVEINCHLVHDETGTPVAVEGIGRDITQRKDEEKILRDSEARFRELVENLPDIFFQLRIFKTDVTEMEKENIIHRIGRLENAGVENCSRVLEEVFDELEPFIDGTIIYANQTASELLGYPLDNVGKIKLHQLIAPDYLKTGLENLFEIIKSGKQFGLEYELLDARGIRIPVDINAYVSSREYPYVIDGVLRDVTSQIKTANQLREAKEYIESIIRSMHDSLIVIDTVMRVHLANKATRELLEYSRGDLKGRRFSDLVVDGTKVEHRLADRIFREKTVQDLEVKYLSKSGEEIPVRLSASLIEIEINDHKQAIGITCVAHDMRRINELQEQVVRSEKMAAIGVLAAGIAHEIKNPLAIILQGIEFLGFFSEKHKDEVVRDSLVRIRKAVLRADKIVKDLLAFSRSRADYYEPQDIAGILEESITLVDRQIGYEQVELVKNFDPGIPMLPVDRNQLLQVFINILINAVEAMPDGGVITIDLRPMLSKAGRKHLEIRFTDNGPGVPDGFIDRIFEPFYSRKKNKGNTGLGLFVARGIIENFQGEIRLENQPGNGAVVTILLPYTKMVE